LGNGLRGPRPSPKNLLAGRGRSRRAATPPPQERGGAASRSAGRGPRSPRQAAPRPGRVVHAGPRARTAGRRRRSRGCAGFQFVARQHLRLRGTGGRIFLREGARRWPTSAFPERGGWRLELAKGAVTGFALFGGRRADTGTTTTFGLRHGLALDKKHVLRSSLPKRTGRRASTAPGSRGGGPGAGG